MKTKNYYVALRFKGREDLHMTLRYFPNRTGTELSDLIETIGKALAAPIKSETFKKFRAVFDIDAWFGPKHTVHVLEAREDHEWPAWLLLLVSKLPKGSDRFGFKPHITCKEDVLDMEVESVALMNRKMEVCKWGLK